MPNEQRLCLEIAGLALDVIVDADVDVSAFSDRAVRYVRAGDRAARYTVEVHRFADGDDSPTRLGPSKSWILQDGTLVVETSGVRLSVPRQGSSATAWLRPDGERYRFENILRLLVTRRALESGGAVLHAAGLVRDGLGVAFPGVSGAGKSTLTLRHPRDMRISEDLLSVRPVDGRWIVEALPFIAFHQLDLGPKQAPLAAFAFLSQAPSMRARAMTTSDVRRALAETLVSYASQGLEPLALDRIVELAAVIPAFVLETNLTSDVWSTIDGFLETSTKRAPAPGVAQPW